MMEFNLVDERWCREGLLKIVRLGNAYEWRVFGVDNFNVPMFTGSAGSFYAAQRAGETRLFKDLKQIFYLLNEASVKERKEGEAGDSELIERVIRCLNAGDKTTALSCLDKIIDVESKEREPGDVRRLQLVRTMILADKPKEESES